MHTQKPLSNSPAVWGITKRGTGKPLRVWSLLHERDKSRNSKLAAIRMAGAFVHWRQVGNLVFNDQLASLRFTFQRSPFCPQLIVLPKLCLISSPQAPGNRHSSSWFFFGGKKNVLISSLLNGSGIKKKKMENLHSGITHPKRKQMCVVQGWFCPTWANTN